MTFKETYNQIIKSDVYKDFIIKNPQNKLCAGFFVMDFISNDSKKSIDFMTKDNIFSFELKDDGFVKMTKDELLKLNQNVELLELDSNIQIETDELKGIAGIEALENGINAKFNKIIAVLQKTKKDEIIKTAWNLTCMLDGLIILNIIVDAITGKILKFERKSFMDMIKKR